MQYNCQNLTEFIRNRADDLGNFGKNLIEKRFEDSFQLKEAIEANFGEMRDFVLERRLTNLSIIHEVKENLEDVDEKCNYPLLITPDGSKLIYFSGKQEIVIQSLEKNGQKTATRIENPFLESSRFELNGPIAISPNGDEIAVKGWVAPLGSILIRFDLKTSRMIGNPKKFSAYSVAFNYDETGKKIICGAAINIHEVEITADNYFASAIDYNTGDDWSMSDEFKADFYKMELANNNSTVVSLNNKGLLAFWNRKEKKGVDRIFAVKNFSVSHDGKRVAYINDLNNKVCIYDYENNYIQSPIKAEAENVAFDATGRFIITEFGGKISVWDLTAESDNLISSYELPKKIKWHRMKKRFLQVTAQNKIIFGDEGGNVCVIGRLGGNKCLSS